MANVDRKWLPPILIGITVVASIVTYGWLPAEVDLQFEGSLPAGMAGQPELAPRWLLAFLMPTLAIALWAAFRFAPTAAGQRFARRLFRHAPEDVTSPAQFERFGKTYDTIVLGVVLLILGVHAALIIAAVGAPGIAVRILPGAFGASLLLMGNVMPRLRPNWVAGIRTRRTFEDPQLWRRVHRVFGAAFVLSGLLTIGCAVVAPRYGLIVGIGSLVLSLIAVAVVSTRVATFSEPAP